MLAAHVGSPGTDGVQIGYPLRFENEVAAELARQAARRIAEGTQIDLPAPSWERLTVAVCLSP